MAGQGPPQEYREKYEWIEGVENLEKYDTGGFHPVMIGDVVNKRYQIVDKLGYGGYSTVWLTRDMRRKTYVALKIGVADSRMHETTVLKSLSDSKPRTPKDPITLSGSNAIPRLLDEFTVRGPNGEHPSYTTALAGSNLRDACEFSMFRLEVARALAVNLVSAIAYMHSRGYLHGDIHLGNAMVRLPSQLDDLSVEQFYDKYGHPQTVTVSCVDGGPLPPSIPTEVVHPLHLGKKAKEISLEETELLLADFGESFSPKSIERPCEDCRSHLAAQPPESHFEPFSPLSFPADIWCLGLAIWNLFSIRPLFGVAFSPPEAIIAQHVDALGPLPARWWSQWEERHDYFDEDGKSIQGKNTGPSLDKAFDDWVQVYRQKLNVGIFAKEEKTSFLQLLRRMLSYDPLERPTAAEVLESDWVVNWAMNDFEKSYDVVQRQENA